MKNLILSSIFTAITATSTFSAAASDFGLVINGACYHTNRARLLNEKNPGLGVKMSLNPSTNTEVGYYLNSYKKTTTYATVSYLPFNFGFVSAGGFAGVATGYKKITGLGLSPIGGAEILLKVNQNINLNLRAVPMLPAKKPTTAVITISATLNF